MKNMQGLKVLFVASILLIFSGLAMAQKQADCSGSTDESITQAINDRISEHKKKNPGKNVMIDVKVENKAVTLTVRYAAKSIHKDVTRYAKNMGCVTKVEVRQPGCQSEGCPKNTYSCEGKCVPCIDVCSPRKP